MKIRTGFVTNSSSSNFIIARKAADPAVPTENTELTKYITAVNLLLLTDNDDDETTEASIFNTKEEYEASFLERYRWRPDITITDILKSDKELAGLYNQVIDHLNRGYLIIDKMVGDDNNCLKQLIFFLTDTGDDFILIKS